MICCGCFISSKCFFSSFNQFSLLLVTILTIRFANDSDIYSRFLEDVFHKWLDNFDIEPFYSTINNLDRDLKFIFENPSKSLNFLDINIRIVENNLVFDIHYKPTNSFNYSTFQLTQVVIHHIQITIISLSLEKHIVSIVTNNREN